MGAASSAGADPAPAAAAHPAPATGSTPLPVVADLDGTYLWLGVSGAATRDADGWDSLFGVQAAGLRVRERSRLAVLGVNAAGARVATTRRWRVALEGVAGTAIGGRIKAGIALGPSLDLADAAHPQLGVGAMVWIFVGLTPYVRVGVLADGTTYLDLGAQLSLPVLRW